MKLLTLIGLFLTVATASAQIPMSFDHPGNPTDDELVILKPGGDIGKGGADDFFADTGDLGQACQGVAAKLRLYYWQADRLSSPEKRRDRLVTGIDRALALLKDRVEVDPRTGRKTVIKRFTYAPVTRAALERGLQINRIFGGPCQSKKENSAEVCKAREDRTAMYALTHFYIWVLRDIIPLETDYFIPIRRDYYYCDYGCVPEDLKRRFVTAYQESALGWLDFYLGRSPGHSDMPEALFYDTWELRMAEYVTGYAGEDLNESLYRRFYRCPIGDLREIYNTLKEYNGSGSGFEDPMEAVLWARQSLTGIDNFLHGQRFCGDGGFAPGNPGSPPTPPRYPGHPRYPGQP